MAQCPVCGKVVTQAGEDVYACHNDKCTSSYPHLWTKARVELAAAMVVKADECCECARQTMRRNRKLREERDRLRRLIVEGVGVVPVKDHSKARTALHAEAARIARRKMGAMNQRTYWLWFAVAPPSGAHRKFVHDVPGLRCSVVINRRKRCITGTVSTPNKRFRRVIRSRLQSTFEMMREMMNWCEKASRKAGHAR